MNINIIKDSSEMSFLERIVQFYILNKTIVKLGLFILIAILLGIHTINYKQLIHRNKTLSKFETVQVLASRRNLKTGELIKAEDLEFISYSKKFYLQRAKNLYSIDEIKSIKEKVINKKLNKDIELGDFIGRDAMYLENKFLLESSISHNQSIFNLRLKKEAAYKFLKLGDYVDLYSKNKKSISKLIAKKVKIIFIENLETNSKLNKTIEEMIISLAVDNKDLKQLLTAKANKSVELIISKNTERKLTAKTPGTNFQSLTISTNQSKRTYYQ
ncbi:MAG: hypothetical protein MK033_09120 [Candidatus Caenarcaniphilales bacterium]|nr:hypothetical protein [Candidatus Caenarcaniphilales bacterium]